MSVSFPHLDHTIPNAYLFHWLLTPKPLFPSVSFYEQQQQADMALAPLSYSLFFSPVFIWSTASGYGLSSSHHHFGSTTRHWLHDALHVPRNFRPLQNSRYRFCGIKFRWKKKTNRFTEFRWSFPNFNVSKIKVGSDIFMWLLIHWIFCPVSCNLKRVFVKL